MRAGLPVRPGSCCVSSIAPKSGASSALKAEPAVTADGRSPGSVAPAESKRKDPLIGKVIHGRFKVLSLIARGGMGKVYRAEQSPLGRICALKVLNPKYEGDEDPEFQRRFFLEASTAAKLTHPNTVTIFDYGRDGDTYFIAMEYIQGRTLYRILREDGTFTEERVARIMRQACRSLREAHTLGVIHRDIKPANIVLSSTADEADTVKILDFGLVKEMAEDKEDLTQQGLFMGSPKYMAPEQILGNAVSAPTDIYSLGVVAYELLTSKVPFDEGASVKTLMAHVNDPPLPVRAANPRASISLDMEAIIMRCLAKEPEDRFLNMDGLLLALTRVEGGGSLTESLRAGPLVTPPRPVAQSGVITNASMLHADRPPAADPTQITPVKGVAHASGPPQPSGSYPTSQPSSPSGPLSAEPSGPYSGPQSGPYSGPQASGSMPLMPPPLKVPHIDTPGYNVHPSGTPEPMSQPATLGQAELAQPRPALAKGMMLVGAVLAVAAGAALALTRGATESAPDAAQTSAATAQAQQNDKASATDSKVPEPTAASSATDLAADGRTVRIVTVPPGAEVKRGDELLCRPTPCEITLTGKGATSPRTVELSMKGYQSADLQVPLGTKQAKLNLKKQAATKGGWPGKTGGPKTPPVAPRPTATATAAKPTVSTPKGYKDSPY